MYLFLGESVVTTVESNMGDFLWNYFGHKNDRKTGGIVFLNRLGLWLETIWGTKVFWEKSMFLEFR